MSDSWSAPYAQLAELLDGAPTVLYCLKDAAGRYLAANQAFVERTSARRRAEVIGGRAGDLFPADLAARYEAQDAEIFASGQPLRDELELITGADGRPGWYVTTKMPVHDALGTVVALAVVSIDLARSEASGEDIAGLHRAIDHVHHHLDRTVGVDEMAAIAGLTVAQLERRMHRVFGLSPKQYVVKARVEEATRLLATTDESLAAIATRCGWYDQSAFTRQFTRVVGCTPGEYRAQR